MGDINFDAEAFICRDPLCKIPSHLNSIDTLYDDIVNALSLAASKTISSKVKRNSHKSIPGWNHYVKEHHTIARDAFNLWRENGSPRQGPIFEFMKKNTF